MRKELRGIGLRHIYEGTRNLGWTIYRSTTFFPVETVAAST